MKKPTLKDIAELANVSAATVSYILNDVKTQAIPKETKDRVWEIAKTLNYIPNLAARSLVSRKTGLIGIMISRRENDGIWRRLGYSECISRLEELLTEKGFHVVYLSLDPSSTNHHIIGERKLDGVFLIDVSDEDFYKISNQFDVPLVLIDSMINDTLFYKILPDYKEAIRKAKNRLQENEPFLIMDNLHNQTLMNAIIQHAGLNPDKLHIVKKERDLALFLEKQKGSKGIIINEFIGILACKYKNPNELSVICTGSCPELLHQNIEAITFKHTSSLVAYEKMMQLLAHGSETNNEKYVLLEAD